MSDQNLSDALAALATAGKRVKVHDSQIVFKAPGSVKKLVEEHAAANGVSAGTVWRWMAAEYFERRGITG